MNDKSYEFFDAHTHANLAAFKDDYREVIRKTLDVGGGLINVGTQKDTSRRAVEIAHEFPDGVYATIGLHPVHTSASFHDEEELGGGDAARAFTSRGEVFDFEYYKNLALDPKVVGIGECGLDYYRVESIEYQEAREKQVAAFEAQIKLAHEAEKPLMIHCRDAFKDLVEILTTSYLLLNTRNPGIMHFFAGTKEDAEELLKLGFSFTFGGVITFVRSYDEVIRIIPIDRIMSETDAPYVAPAPYRGKRNEPFYVQEVVKKLAELKDVSEEEMRRITVENTRRVFKI